MPKREKTQPKYPKYSPERHGNTVISRALAALGLSINAARKILPGPPSRPAIAHWRSSRCAPPNEVCEILAARLEACAKNYLVLAESVRQLRFQQFHRLGNRALTAWQAHRLARKEKARD